MGDRARSLTIDGVRPIKDLKVVELKAELERRGLSKSGSKKELVERLRSSVQFENTKSKATAAISEEDVPNKWLQNEANLDNDFIREYFQSQKALYRQQIEARRQYRAETTTSVPGTSLEDTSHSNPQPTPPTTPEAHQHPKSKSQTQPQQLSSHQPPPSLPPTPEKVRPKKQKSDGFASVAVAIPESPSTSSTTSSRPSRSSARAARVLSRVSLEDSEDDDFEREEELEVRKSRSKRGSRQFQTEPPSDPVTSTPPGERCVPSLRIRLPDPHVLPDLTDRKTEASRREAETGDGKSSRCETKRQEKVVSGIEVLPHTAKRQQQVTSEPEVVHVLHSTRRQPKTVAVPEILPHSTRRQQKLEPEPESLFKRQQQAATEPEVLSLNARRQQQATSEPEVLHSARREQQVTSEPEVLSLSTRGHHHLVSEPEVLTHSTRRQQQVASEPEVLSHTTKRYPLSVSEPEVPLHTNRRQQHAAPDINIPSLTTRRQLQSVPESSDTSPPTLRKHQQSVSVTEPLSHTTRSKRQAPSETEALHSIRRQQQTVVPSEILHPSTRRQRQAATESEVVSYPTRRHRQSASESEATHSSRLPDKLDSKLEYKDSSYEISAQVVESEKRRTSRRETRRLRQSVSESEDIQPSTKRAGQEVSPYSTRRTVEAVQPISQPSRKSVLVSSPVLDHKLDQSESRAIVALTRIPECDLRAAKEKSAAPSHIIPPEESKPVTGRSEEKKVLDETVAESSENKDKAETSRNKLKEIEKCLETCVSECLESKHTNIPKLSEKRESAALTHRTSGVDCKEPGDLDKCEADVSKSIAPAEKSDFGTTKSKSIIKVENSDSGSTKSKSVIDVKSFSSGSGTSKSVTGVEKSVSVSDEINPSLENLKPKTNEIKPELIHCENETFRPRSNVLASQTDKTKPEIIKSGTTAEVAQVKPDPDKVNLPTEATTAILEKARPDTVVHLTEREKLNAAQCRAKVEKPGSEVDSLIPKSEVAAPLIVQGADPLLEALRRSDILPDLSDFSPNHPAQESRLLLSTHKSSADAQQITVKETVTVSEDRNLPSDKDECHLRREETDLARGTTEKRVTADKTSVKTAPLVFSGSIERTTDISKLSASVVTNEESSQVTKSRSVLHKTEVSVPIESSSSHLTSPVTIQLSRGLPLLSSPGSFSATSSLQSTTPPGKTGIWEKLRETAQIKKVEEADIERSSVDTSPSLVEVTALSSQTSIFSPSDSNKAVHSTTASEQHTQSLRPLTSHLHNTALKPVIKSESETVTDKLSQQVSKSDKGASELPADSTKSTADLQKLATGASELIPDKFNPVQESVKVTSSSSSIVTDKFAGSVSAAIISSTDTSEQTVGHLETDISCITSDVGSSCLPLVPVPKGFHPSAKSSSFEPTAYSISNLLSRGSKDQLHPLQVADKEEEKVNKGLLILHPSILQAPTTVSEVKCLDEPKQPQTDSGHSKGHSKCDEKSLLFNKKSSVEKKQLKSVTDLKSKPTLLVSTPEPNKVIIPESEKKSEPLVPADSSESASEVNNTTSIVEDKKHDLIENIQLPVSTDSTQSEKTRNKDPEVVSGSLPDTPKRDVKQCSSESVSPSEKLTPSLSDHESKPYTPWSLEFRSPPVSVVQPTHKFQSIESLIGDRTVSKDTSDKTCFEKLVESSCSSGWREDKKPQSHPKLISKSLVDKSEDSVQTSSETCAKPKIWDNRESSTGITSGAVDTKFLATFEAKIRTVVSDEKREVDLLSDTRSEIQTEVPATESKTVLTTSTEKAFDIKSELSSTDSKELDCSSETAYIFENFAAATSFEKKPHPQVSVVESITVQQQKTGKEQTPEADSQVKQSFELQISPKPKKDLIGSLAASKKYEQQISSESVISITEKSTPPKGSLDSQRKEQEQGFKAHIFEAVPAGVEKPDGKIVDCRKEAECLVSKQEPLEASEPIESASHHLKENLSPPKPLKKKLLLSTELIDSAGESDITISDTEKGQPSYLPPFNTSTPSLCQLKVEDTRRQGEEQITDFKTEDSRSSEILDSSRKENLDTSRLNPSERVVKGNHPKGIPDQVQHHKSTPFETVGKSALVNEQSILRTEQERIENTEFQLKTDHTSEDKSSKAKGTFVNTDPGIKLDSKFSGNLLVSLPQGTSEVIPRVTPLPDIVSPPCTSRGNPAGSRVDSITVTLSSKTELKQRFTGFTPKPVFGAFVSGLPKIEFVPAVSFPSSRSEETLASSQQGIISHQKQEAQSWKSEPRNKKESGSKKQESVKRESTERIGQEVGDNDELQSKKQDLIKKEQAESKKQEAVSQAQTGIKEQKAGTKEWTELSTHKLESKDKSLNYIIYCAEGPGSKELPGNKQQEEEKEKWQSKEKLPVNQEQSTKKQEEKSTKQASSLIEQVVISKKHTVDKDEAESKRQNPETKKEETVHRKEAENKKPEVLDKKQGAFSKEQAESKLPVPVSEEKAESKTQKVLSKNQVKSKQQEAICKDQTERKKDVVGNKKPESLKEELVSKEQLKSKQQLPGNWDQPEGKQQISENKELLESQQQVSGHKEQVESKEVGSASIKPQDIKKQEFERSEEKKQELKKQEPVCKEKLEIKKLEPVRLEHPERQNQKPAVKELPENLKQKITKEPSVYKEEEPGQKQEIARKEQSPTSREELVIKKQTDFKDHESEKKLISSSKQLPEHKQLPICKEPAEASKQQPVKEVSETLKQPLVTKEQPSNSQQLLPVNRDQLLISKEEGQGSKEQSLINKEEIAVGKEHPSLSKEELPVSKELSEGYKEAPVSKETFEKDKLNLGRKSQAPLSEKQDCSKKREPGAEEKAQAEKQDIVSQEIAVKEQQASHNLESPNPVAVNKGQIDRKQSPVSKEQSVSQKQVSFCKEHSSSLKEALVTQQPGTKEQEPGVRLEPQETKQKSSCEEHPARDKLLSVNEQQSECAKPVSVCKKEPTVSKVGAKPVAVCKEEPTASKVGSESQKQVLISKEQLLVRKEQELVCKEHPVNKDQPLSRKEVPENQEEVSFSKEQAPGRKEQVSSGKEQLLLSKELLPVSKEQSKRKNLEQVNTEQPHIKEQEPESIKQVSLGKEEESKRLEQVITGGIRQRENEKQELELKKQDSGSSKQELTNKELLESKKQELISKEFLESKKQGTGNKVEAETSKQILASKEETGSTEERNGNKQEPPNKEYEVTDKQIERKNQESASKKQSPSRLSDPSVTKQLENKKQETESKQCSLNKEQIQSSKTLLVDKEKIFTKEYFENPESKKQEPESKKQELVIRKEELEFKKQEAVITKQPEKNQKESESQKQEFGNQEHSENKKKDCAKEHLFDKTQDPGNKEHTERKKQEPENKEHPERKKQEPENKEHPERKKQEPENKEHPERKKQEPENNEHPERKKQEAENEHPETKKRESTNEELPESKKHKPKNKGLPENFKPDPISRVVFESKNQETGKKEHLYTKKQEFCNKVLLESKKQEPLNKEHIESRTQERKNKEKPVTEDRGALSTKQNETERKTPEPVNKNSASGPPVTFFTSRFPVAFLDIPLPEPRFPPRNSQVVRTGARHTEGVGTEVEVQRPGAASLVKPVNILKEQQKSEIDCSVISTERISSFTLNIEMARRRKTEVSEAGSESSSQQLKKTGEDVDERQEETAVAQGQQTKGRNDDSSNGDVGQKQAERQEEEEGDNPRSLRSSRSRSKEKDLVSEMELSRRRRTLRGRRSQSNDQDEFDKEPEHSGMTPRQQRVRRRSTREDSVDKDSIEEEDGSRTPLRKSRRRQSSRSQEEEENEEERKSRVLESIQEVNETSTETPKKTCVSEEGRRSRDLEEEAGSMKNEKTDDIEEEENNKREREAKFEKDKSKSPGGVKNKKEKCKETKAMENSEKGEKKSGEESDSEDEDERRRLSRPKLLRNEVRKVEEKLRLLEQKHKGHIDQSRSRSSSPKRSSEDKKETSPERRKREERREETSQDKRKGRESPDKRKKREQSPNSRRKKEEESPEKRKRRDEKKEDGEASPDRRRKRDEEKTRTRPRLTRNEVKVSEYEKEREEKKERSARKDRSPSDISRDSRSPTQKRRRKRNSSSSSSSSSSSQSRSRSRKRHSRDDGLRKRDKGGDRKKDKDEDRRKDEEEERSRRKSRRSRSRSPKDRSRHGDDTGGRDREHGENQHQDEDKENREAAAPIDYSSFKSVRKVTLSRGRSRDEEQREPEGEEQKPRKRKWGSSSTDKSSLDISSASLKRIIPDVKPLSASEVHMGDDSEAESGEASDEASGGAEGSLVEGPEPPPPVAANRRGAEDDEEMEGDKERRMSGAERRVRESSPVSVPGKQRCRSRTPELKVVRKIKVFEGPGSGPSKPAIAPARNPPSCVVVITNLVRPFTFNQLRELLLRTGRLVPDGFWLDNIKSKCLAMYETEDQAHETRMALHGVRWPVSNPKNLVVDFSTEEEMKKRMEESATPQQKLTDERRDERWRREGVVREWDLAKIGERSPGERERERERLRREREEERLREQHAKPRTPPPREQEKVEEPPPKSLDDLFIKTKAQPAIYWLPLTAQQIAEKEAQRRLKMAEVERRQAEMKAAREKEQAELERARAERKKEREREREKEKEREKERERNTRRASRSRSRSRRRGSRSPLPSRRSPIGKRSSPGRSPRRSPGKSRRSPSRDSPRRSRRRTRTRSRSRS